MFEDFKRAVAGESFFIYDGRWTIIVSEGLLPV
jgi:hypothetical protein